MRITEPNDMLAARYAQLGPHESLPARGQLAEQQRGGPPGPGLLSVLDTDHDGWLDEDDIPYDHLVLRERELQSSQADAAAGAPRGDAEVGAIYTRAVATPSPVPAGEVRSAEADPKARGEARIGPQIDLLA